MARTWSDFFDKGGSRSYEDYYIKPTHFLKNGTKRDGYVLKLNNGVNWRFCAKFPDADVAKAYAMAKEEFVDMDVQKWNRNAKSNIANIRICKTCGNLSDTDICSICSNHSRNHSLVCIVENIRDIIAIEQTGTYRGTYHVLGGLISPMDGVGPSELNISSLTQRIEQGGIDEIIFALSANMEGDTTCFYLSRLISGKGIKISQIARGVAFGGDLEYTDEITLSRSIENRTEYGQGN